MAAELQPIQMLAESVAALTDSRFIGIDTSLNPSLDEGGSVGAAVEALDEVDTFGNSGTLAAAAAITTALQSLQRIQHCGYSGLVLPVCEDRRLAKKIDDWPNYQTSRQLLICCVSAVSVVLELILCPLPEMSIPRN